MRYFVTGLCLQGNKGGPAIGLSLMSQIRQHDPTARFVFSVPSKDFQRERSWARRYKVDVVEAFHIKDLLPLFYWQRFPRRPARIYRWLRQMMRSDVVVDMSGVSYVGPPMGSNRAVLLAGRFYYWLLARALRKPFVAWTQSYGPFSTRLVRLMCRLDLGTQPVIMCRGADCRAEVGKILPNAATATFPDVAVVLPYERDWAKTYIAGLASGARLGRIATVSPSAVAEHHARSIGGRSHIELVTAAVGHLAGKGYTVILVPHTFRPDDHDISVCDHAIAQRVHETVRDRGVLLVSEDLSPNQLKSVISLADVHVGARYHSIVASLSAGVPTLALSWHPKYRDIMRMYRVESYVVEQATSGIEDTTLRLLDDLIGSRDAVAVTLRDAQAALAEAVAENTRLFVRTLRDSWGLEIRATGV